MKGRGAGFSGFHTLILAVLSVIVFTGLPSCAGTPRSQTAAPPPPHPAEAAPPAQAAMPEIPPAQAAAPTPTADVPPASEKPELGLSRAPEIVPPPPTKASPVPPPDSPDTGLKIASPAASHPPANIPPPAKLPVPSTPSVAASSDSAPSPYPPKQPSAPSAVSSVVPMPAVADEKPPSQTLPREKTIAAPPPKEKSEPSPPSRPPNTAAAGASGPPRKAPAPAEVPVAASSTLEPDRNKAAPAAAPRATAGREMAAEIGRAIKISLPGLGWIFLGDDRETGKIRYQGKEILEGITVFSFLAYDEGNYNLRFQQQDLAVGTITYDNVKLAVAPALPPQAAPVGTSPVVAAPAPQPARSAQSAPAESLPEVRIDTEPEDVKYRRLLEEGRISEAPAGIEGFVEINEDQLKNLDEWYIKLGRFFENDPVHRDIKKALGYYERVHARFPLSEYWDEATRRGAYIRRNFFEIR